MLYFICSYHNHFAGLNKCQNVYTTLTWELTRYDNHKYLGPFDGGIWRDLEWHPPLHTPCPQTVIRTEWRTTLHLLFLSHQSHFLHHSYHFLQCCKKKALHLNMSYHGSKCRNSIYPKYWYKFFFSLVLLKRIWGRNLLRGYQEPIIVKRVA